MSMRATVFTACAVTWFNVQAVIDGTMIFGAFKATMTDTEALHYILGVISASCLWFIGLTLAVSLAGGIITPRVLNIINKICGTVIILYGIKLLRHFWLML